MLGSSALRILEKNGKVRRKGWEKNTYWHRCGHGLSWDNNVEVDVNNYFMFLLNDWEEFKIINK